VGSNYYTYKSILEQFSIIRENIATKNYKQLALAVSSTQNNKYAIWFSGWYRPVFVCGGSLCLRNLGNGVYIYSGGFVGCITDANRMCEVWLREAVAVHMFSMNRFNRLSNGLDQASGDHTIMPPGHVVLPLFIRNLDIL
jgi:hypothetical protein